MDAVNRRSLPDGISGERGFSMIEVMIATMILTVGLLPLVGVFAIAVQRIGSSTPMMIAREKAREAIESVHSARDTGNASWGTILNQADGGAFSDNPEAIRAPGADGLVNTDDDGDPELPEGMYTREIDIHPIYFDGTETVNPNLRELRVIVRYLVNNVWQTYEVVTYISAYS